MEATDRGADEALMLDANGYVAEASVDNIFVATHRGLMTPPTATNLAGITRETVVEIADTLGVPCEERFFNLVDVWSAREVFICGTGAEIVPVTTVDGRTIGSGTVGSLTGQIMDAYRRLVCASGTPIDAAVGVRH
jgi:branched-chain amino acid aminotransferase